MTSRIEAITTRWEPDGSITPLQFTWKGQVFVVASVGRSWRAEDGYHVLCMPGGDAVFELLLTPELAWWLREPAGRKAG
jgi:putative intracellular protease/amidase